jgi:hypothetical protein
MPEDYAFHTSYNRRQLQLVTKLLITYILDRKLNDW